MQWTQGYRRSALAAAAIGVAASLVAGTMTPSVQARSHAAAPARSTTFINGAGSTFIYPLMLKWGFTYANTVNKSVRVNYQAIGSGAGIAQFTAGTVDFGASDAPATDAQIKAAGGDVLHIPLTLGPVAIIYNLPSVKTQLKLDGPTLAQIYLGKITKWDDKVIATLNPGVNLPSIPIVVAHRSDGSGTTFIFTSYLDAVSSDWKANVGASTTVNWAAGQGGRGNAGVAAIVHQSAGGIGYVELTYAASTNQPIVLIKNKAGKYVAPSVAGASADAANAGAVPSDLRAVIVDSPGDASYPISGFSWALIHQKAPNTTKYGPLLNFLWWAIHDGQKLSSSGPLRYAPLSANIVKADEAQIKKVTYNGKPVFTGH